MTRFNSHFTRYVDAVRGWLLCALLSVGTVALLLAFPGPYKTDPSPVPALVMCFAFMVWFFLYLSDELVMLNFLGLSENKKLSEAVTDAFNGDPFDCFRYSTAIWEGGEKGVCRLYSLRIATCSKMPLNGLLPFYQVKRHHKRYRVYTNGAERHTKFNRDLVRGIVRDIHWAQRLVARNESHDARVAKSWRSNCG